MSLNDAIERVRQAHLKGIQKYQRVLSLSTSKHIPLCLAEVHVQAMLGQRSALKELRDARRKRRLDRKANVLMTELDISLEHAVPTGDETARARIRQVKHFQSPLHPNSTV